MYDLSVVDSLGALDSDANGAYQWAANYIVATTYWDVSWASAVEAFGALYAQTPYFTEVGGMTVAERYRMPCISAVKNLPSKKTGVPRQIIIVVQLKLVCIWTFR